MNTREKQKESNEKDSDTIYKREFKIYKVKVGSYSSKDEDENKDKQYLE